MTEKLILTKSRKSFFLEYLMVAVAMAILLTIAIKGSKVNGLVIVFAIIAILVGLAIPEIARTREVFTVTNEAVTIKKGILSKKEHQFHIATITDVNYTQNPWQRLLNYGTLIMTSFSPSGKMIKVGSVDNPAKIMNTINKLVDAKHGKSETEPDVKEKEE